MKKNFKIFSPDEKHSLSVTKDGPNKFIIDCNINEHDVVYFGYMMREHKVPATLLVVFPGQMPSGRIIVINGTPKTYKDDDQCMQFISDAFQHYFNAVSYGGRF